MAVNSLAVSYTTQADVHPKDQGFIEMGREWPGTGGQKLTTHPPRSKPSISLHPFLGGGGGARWGSAT